MIEINLLPGKRKKTSGGGGGGGFRLQMPDFKAFLAQVKDPWLAAAVGAAGLLIAFVIFTVAVQATRVSSLRNRYEEVLVEKRRFDVVIAKKRQQERLRDSLASEIQVIRGIDSDRYIWPHILDQVTKALPPYTWLTSVQGVSPQTQAPGAAPGTLTTQFVDSAGRPTISVSIDGRTVDIQAYTTFLRQLANSPWFTDVQPQQSTTVVESDRPVTAFNVTLRYRVADSVYLRTVPLAQSMR
jgi:Tfp pilus assembly protein PilN